MHNEYVYSVYVVRARAMYETLQPSTDPFSQPDIYALQVIKKTYTHIPSTVIKHNLNLNVTRSANGQ